MDECQKHNIDQKKQVIEEFCSFTAFNYSSQLGKFENVLFRNTCIDGKNVKERKEMINTKFMMVLNSKGKKVMTRGRRQ